MGSGYLQAVHVLNQVLEKDIQKHGDSGGQKDLIEVQQMLQEEFTDWLGESKYMHGLTTIPPTRFAKTNPNGLWEYSPFLCGVGLLEGLELSYRLSLVLWDRLPDPVLLIHLHNMLVQKGYIQQPVGLYAIFQNLFTECFFTDGKIPTSNFVEAFNSRINEMNKGRHNQRASVRNAARAGLGLHGILDISTNNFFKKKSNILLYREVDWNPDRIEDKDITVGSLLAMLRLSQTRKILDPETGKHRLEETELVKRHLAQKPGLDADELLDKASSFQKGFGKKEVSIP
ncbi:hypothetical protein Daus18300_009757 [Diaporthe australafricana]|uniref:Uncharacterized protein n=1 Tax=Diaporthe australafricana TaxID=127596 RepID=A0ABR3WCR7_9PEZI